MVVILKLFFKIHFPFVSVPSCPTSSQKLAKMVLLTFNDVMVQRREVESDAAIAAAKERLGAARAAFMVNHLYFVSLVLRTFLYFRQCIIFLLFSFFLFCLFCLCLCVFVCEYSTLLQSFIDSFRAPPSHPTGSERGARDLGRAPNAAHSRPSAVRGDTPCFLFVLVLL